MILKQKNNAILSVHSTIRNSKTLSQIVPDASFGVCAQ